MGKKVAVIALNPVNGSGLFQYLEAFFENGISYQIFAIAESKDIKTNSGISISLDHAIADLKGKENEYDALVFACGDAMMKLAENADKQYNKDMFEVVAKFNEQGKLIAGHCAAAVIFDKSGIADGKKMAVHPYGKAGVLKGIPTDEKSVVDHNLYTAQTESYIWTLLPELLAALK
ncbi:DJ-1/PfpI family protein [Dysgonomonas sp. ZJ709]|uniref:DJ-1/PfpI family protein n=1 Tax=Dysgonomonas sp. ZJ709 TaxID=2709797 RepID=UPI0013EB8CCE|nr:DJ-1/PfpI family protein [Dysgonomonas sp. ZJ709]